MAAGSDELLDALDAIDPAKLDYGEWCEVGMALKREGYGVEAWDSWSARDPARYEPGGCERKWDGFGPRETEVTGKLVFRLAYDAGWEPERSGSSFGWSDEVEVRDGPRRERAVSRTVTDAVVDASDVGEDEVPDGQPASVADEVIRYLTALFEPDDHVGYVTTEAEAGKDGRWRPVGSGNYDRTRDELIRSLKRSDDITKTFGSYRHEAGAWVRINPVDGDGVGNRNVTRFRHALVESDELPVGKQVALIRAMRLPVSAIVTSGGKSVHAVVRVDAEDARQYAERVRALYEYCRKSGFPVDEQNKNPSRLSRLPGFERGPHWQRIVQIGPGDAPASWDEWQDWVIDETSGLPSIVTLSDVTEMPPLSPQLIHGVLRDGQKGMLVGPSKAGKSFALIELAIAVVGGWDWMGHRCARGRVLYINLEIQQASFLHRIADVYRSMSDARGLGRPTDAEALSHLSDLDVWNLRGHSKPLDRLVPSVLKKAANRGYRLVIIDPIYKVLTGDENSASDMAVFTNQFDVIASELKCAVFYAHHHAKGEMGKRVSMDRASGSGVFARDPDAILDMSPLVVPPEDRDALRYSVMGDDGQPHERHATAFRISYTLREFESPPPRDVVFAWPLHIETDALRGCRVVGEYQDPRESSARASRAKSERAAGRWDEINALVGDAVDALAGDGAQPTVANVMGWIRLNRPGDSGRLELTEDLLKRWSTPSQRRAKYSRFEWVKEAPEGGGPYILVQA